MNKRILKEEGRYDENEQEKGREFNYGENERYKDKKKGKGGE